MIAWLFPLFWIGISYKAYDVYRDDYWILIKLHIPIIICFFVAITQQAVLGANIGFLEWEHLIVHIEGTIAQKAFLPMCLFAALLPLNTTDETIYYISFYLFSIIWMAVISLVGYKLRQKEIEINERIN